MGPTLSVYNLRRPIPRQESIDESNNKLDCGASSIRGWRCTGEDALNCILDYDTDTSFLAVYDGHGGHEVAKYCAQELPNFIKNTPEYKEGKIEEALITGFLQLDALITTRPVINVLKKIAAERKEFREYDGDKEESESDDDEEESENNDDEDENVTKKSNSGKVDKTDKEPPKLKNDDDDEDEGVRTSIASSSSSRINEKLSSECASTEVSTTGDKSSEGDKPEVNAPEKVSEPEKEPTSSDTKEEVAQSEEKKEIQNGQCKEMGEKDGADLDNDDDDNSIMTKRGPGWYSGCTAVVALLKGNELYVANAGDSRCIVCRNGKAVAMTFDQRPGNKSVYQRIATAGGKERSGQVSDLHLVRAFGDHAFKQNKALSDREQMITALPVVKKVTIGPKDEFIVLACDGIWNSMPRRKMVDFVKQRISEGREKTSKICEEMLDHCLASLDSGRCDNMTAIIVRLKTLTISKREPSSPVHGEKKDAKRPKNDIDSEAQGDSTV